MKSRMILIALIFLWTGLVLGISFIEAPLKFQAPDVTTEIGLGIGRIVFTAMNRMEWVFVLGILICLASGKIGPSAWLVLALPIAILFLQTFFLLPPLHERTDRLLAGHDLEPSNRHLWYIVTEVVKFLGMLGAGVHALRAFAFFTSQGSPQKTEH